MKKTYYKDYMIVEMPPPDGGKGKPTYAVFNKYQECVGHAKTLKGAKDIVNTPDEEDSGED